ncbi:hypothetical protein GCK72_022891 [Caenorhabditis remanei]|uniref:ZP domain-containing protein n=1 Tax=Caenorhabditis remanei TaxID=31234 RepID=A0A6A5FVA2_CAERE|nr:hypothetical protein GCK72_022891 [Caenorhabditis remanei]KAF1746435.1 hypothetical protein GCK72_022891 [Caenorhabditis remanei]
MTFAEIVLIFTVLVTCGTSDQISFEIDINCHLEKTFCFAGAILLEEELKADEELQKIPFSCTLRTITLSSRIECDQSLQNSDVISLVSVHNCTSNGQILRVYKNLRSTTKSHLNLLNNGKKVYESKNSSEGTFDDLVFE